MKFFLMFLAVMLVSGTSFMAQPLVVDAGPDRHICLPFNNNPVIGANNGTLGGTPATGGTAPYTYNWTFFYSAGATNYNASSILMSNGIANPQLKTSLPSGLLNKVNLPYIKLTITDAVGATASDSVKVSWSGFMMSLAQYAYTIQEGDSVYLTMGVNIGGGVLPYKYLWRPNSGLSDSTSRNFWVKQEGAYTPTITDSMGCMAKFGVFYFVDVRPVGITEIETLDFDVHILSNTISQEQTLVISNDKEAMCQIELYNLAGQHLKTIFTGKILMGKNTIPHNTANLANSIYFYKIIVGGDVYTKKFVKD